jgi:hypothetical protein
MVYTRGNVIVNYIKIGDVHYEYEYGMYVKSKVISLPVRDEDGLWKWKSEMVDKDGVSKIIDYAVNEKYPHYGPNLYDYEAYKPLYKIMGDELK